MQLVEYISKNEADTVALARMLALKAPKTAIYTLKGTLGMGKSVFARGFIRTLMGGEVEVPSPTFTLVQHYEAPQTEIWHFDLYRIEDPQEIYEIGWEEAAINGISLIEWSERLGDILPDHHIEIAFEPLEKSARKIMVSAPDELLEYVNGL